MVKCVCGKPVDKYPEWYASVTVDIVCNNCPKRQVKTIAQLHAEQTAAMAKASEGKDIELDELEEEDEMED